jgi:hypothetical protein
MAQRRMFSLKIVDTDKFLEMPQGARLLYYDLSMRADDDGFVDSPRKIIQLVGASPDDFKILCAKEYIIPFDSGVVVIKDWRVHNLIRHDRYTETEYKNEKKSLEVVGNKYVIPNGNQMAPQVRLGKVRLGKDNKIVKEKKSCVKKTQENDPTFGIIRKWFEENNSEYYHGPKHAVAINKIIDRFKDVEKIIKVCEKYKTRIYSSEKYWRELPLTPAVMLSHLDSILKDAPKEKQPKPFKDRNAYLESMEQLIDEGLAHFDDSGKIIFEDKKLIEG